MLCETGYVILRQFVRFALPGVLAIPALATTYEVGDAKPYTSIGAVPWNSLLPGDTVLIYWRSAPYKEKWVICRQGTAAAPITVRGVANASGRRPVIDGNGAVTAPGLNYWSETRGVLKIGGANIPSDTTPKYIVIENLDIRGARSAYSFRADDGSTQAYSANASPIYLEKGENITIRNTLIHDGGNGLFVASSDALPSRNILVQRNYIYDNGNVNSIYEHNAYTAAIGITFEYNRFGPLRSGAGGNNLKDRSAGTVVRYNWIEGGNRQLDLVDAEDSVAIRTDPEYTQTFVYGNILIEPAGAGNRQIVHYGGDSGATSTYRRGTLYLYNNTVVSTRTDRTTLLRLSTDNEHCDARNNAIYTTAAGNTLSILDETGTVDFQHNWLKPGWAKSFSTTAAKVNNLGGNVEGSSPGFVNEGGQNYRPGADSALNDAGTALHASAADVTREYVKHRKSRARYKDLVLDIGAFEFKP
jgi:hypothetical protein